MPAGKASKIAAAALTGKQASSSKKKKQTEKGAGGRDEGLFKGDGTSKAMSKVNPFCRASTHSLMKLINAMLFHTPI